MKTIITASNDLLTGNFDKRFGRAAYFCVYNEDTGTHEFIENKSKDAQGGAGTKAAESMINLGAKKIISGDFGPKAKELLDKFQVQMVIIEDDNQTIEAIINKLK